MEEASSNQPSLKTFQEYERRKTELLEKNQHLTPEEYDAWVKETTEELGI